MTQSNLSPEERYALKWMLIGAFVTAGATALCDLGKTEIQGWLQRRREKNEAESRTERGVE